MTEDGLPRAAEVAERVLAASRAEACIVLLEDSSQSEVRFANNRTTTNGVRRSRQITVVSFARASGANGWSVGVASGTGAGSPDDVARLVETSAADARDAAPAEDEAPLLGPGNGAEASGSFAEPGPETGLGVFATLLEDLRDATGRARASGRVLAGFAAHEVSTTYLASSTGLRLRHVQPGGTFEMVARSSDGTASSWVGRATRDFSGVSLAELDAELERRLAWSGRRIELPAGRYEALLPPDAVADLIIPLYEATSGREAEDGRSVFSAPGGGTRLGERLTRLGFDLSSDPALAGLECAPFLLTGSSGADVSVFDNGLPIARTSWIADGRLQRLRYHRAGAARTFGPGSPATPPVDNLALELPGASSTLDELVASTRRGLLLTCLWYIREVDLATLLLTGLTRDGVYLVEGGEVVASVNNFRFNESPIDVLDRALEAGASVPALSREWGEWLSRAAMPPLRVADFNMSSVSPAS